jgi:DNA-binding NarL/FixJ family response regulator
LTVRIAIVDDNPAVLRAARSLLETQGLAVVGVAKTIGDALRLVEELMPEVLLIDIDLGSESGLELARRVASLEGRPGVRSILISARDEAEYADLIAASPAIGFLSKSELSAEAVCRLLAGAQGEGRS